MKKEYFNWLCLKGKMQYWAVGFSRMPQRGYGLQPRVAASATLGTSKKRNFNRNAVASFSQRENATSRRNRVAVEGKIFSLPRVAETATLGCGP